MADHSGGGFGGGCLGALLGGILGVIAGVMAAVAYDAAYPVDVMPFGNLFVLIYYVPIGGVLGSIGGAVINARCQSRRQIGIGAAIVLGLVLLWYFFGWGIAALCIAIGVCYAARRIGYPIGFVFLWGLAGIIIIGGCFIATASLVLLANQDHLATLAGVLGGILGVITCVLLWRRWGRTRQVNRGLAIGYFLLSLVGIVLSLVYANTQPLFGTEGSPTGIVYVIGMILGSAAVGLIGYVALRATSVQKPEKGAGKEDSVDSQAEQLTAE